MRKPPEIPKVYYFYCPSCRKMKDYFEDKLEPYDKGLLAYHCRGCDCVYAMPKDKVPLDERSAYETAVSILDNMLNIRCDELIKYKLENRKIKVIETMANSLVYANIKAFKEIKFYLKKKEYKLAKISCNEMIKFIESNRDRAKNNKMVKELVSGKVKIT